MKRNQLQLVILALAFLFASVGVLTSQVPDRVEQFLLELTVKAKEQLGPEKTSDKIDFSRYLKEWAKANGLTVAQAEAEVNRWVAAAEKGNDSYKMGLAAFYKKDFRRAVEQFNQSALAKATQVSELKEKNQLTEQANISLLREGAHFLRLTARASLFNSDVVTAATLLQNAASYTSRKDFPEAWAGTILELGQVYSELGLRTKEEDSEKLFAQSAEAFRRALEVYTREAYSQEWAQCQNSLGATLATQGLRTEGEAGAKLLADGAEALKKSLEVFTRNQSPLQCAKTQNNLGAALAEQGMRGTGEAGLRLLLDAIQAYRAALEVRTYEAYPQEWASTQSNLATVYYFMNDWPKVAECYTNVLKVFPNSQLAYRTANELNQIVLFNFDVAFQQNQEWLRKNPNDLLEKVKLVEKLFTTGKFQESQSQVAIFAANKDYSPLVHSVMRVIEICNLIALKNSAAVPAKLDSLMLLIKGQSDNFKIEFNTAGMQHYINQNPLFASHRDWLLKFLSAVDAETRDAIFIALGEVKVAFLAANSN